MPLKIWSTNRVQFSRTRVLIAAFLVAALTLFTYLPALQNDFVNWDDDKYVYENQNIHSLDFKLLGWSFGVHILNWHPLTFISHSIDYAIWRLNPMGHHLSSIILHAANTFLLFLLIVYLILNTKLSKSSVYKAPGDFFSISVIAGMITVLLFGIHPMHVESVAWIAERKGVLSTFFVLLSLIFYSKYVVRQETQKQSVNYILSLFFFILALMSKPMAITLPIIFVIMDIYPFQRVRFKEIFKAHKKVIIEKIPFFFFSLIVSVLTTIAQYSGGAVTPLKLYPLHFRIAAAIKGLSFYLEKMVFPIDLSPFYPLPKSIQFLSFEYVFPMILITLISIFCLWTWKRGQKVFMVVWVYYIVTLLPVIGIIQLGEQAAADRYSYLPSIGPFFLAGLGISLAWGKSYPSKGVIYLSKVLIIFALILSLFKLSILTSKQINIWKDSITLWSYELKRYPDFWLAYYNRAHAYTNGGDYQQALKDLEKAIQYNPQYASSYYIRAIDYIGLRDPVKALSELDKAIKLDPQFAQAYYIRANTYIKLENYQAALKDLDKIIDLKTQFITEAYRDKQEIYKKINDHKSP